MNRRADEFLKNWLHDARRKPLVIRGARQVGKTWLVRDFAASQKRQLVELNFEKNPQMATLFSSNEPKKTLARLEAALDLSIDPGQSLLFLDEIQAVPDLFAKLRWFAEDLPELPVIAAGSLLEFVLSDHTFSMPVGRIGYMHLEPLSFEEFLDARGRQRLCRYLEEYSLNQEMPVEIHRQLLSLFREYVAIGGMPAAVSTWVTQQSLPQVAASHHDLLATYRADFSKYRGRLPSERIEEVMLATPRQLGQKFVIAHVNPEVHSKSIKQAISLLNEARVCHSVVSTAANGVPLAAETNEKFFKEIFLDVGLCCAALGLSYHHITDIDDLVMVNRGAIAEQVVGQLLRTIDPFYVEPELYYWHRAERTSQAEVDYVIQHGHQVIPIEVKSGATGTLKSLQLFMNLRKLPHAIKVSSSLPSLAVTQFTLLSVPFYLCGQLHRLVDEVIELDRPRTPRSS